MASPELGRMGMMIHSFVIKDVYDNVQYLDSLGKARTAIVKRDADIGTALAKRDSGIREAECLKESQDVKYQTESNIQENKKNLNIEKASFDKEVRSATANVELAYKLKASSIQQDLTNETLQIKVVERKKNIEVEAKEIERKQKELVSMVKLPAQAEAFKIITETEGKKARWVATAEARAERVKIVGSAEAKAIEAIGQAEAESMRLKADAFKQYGEAAKLAMVLEHLPNLAGKIAAPLSKTGDIVLLGDNGNSGDINNQVNKLLATLPPSVSALSGVDISGVLAKLPGATFSHFNSTPTAI